MSPLLRLQAHSWCHHLTFGTETGECPTRHGDAPPPGTRSPAPPLLRSPPLSTPSSEMSRLRLSMCVQSSESNPTSHACCVPLLCLVASPPCHYRAVFGLRFPGYKVVLSKKISIFMVSERKREAETSISCLPCTPRLRIDPETCVLTGNGTHNPLVHEVMLQPIGQPSPGLLYMY